MLERIKNFLSNRFQRVVLNWQTYEWDKINAGVPQDSILGPLFFLLYINEFTDRTSSLVKLFADDKSPFPFVQNKNNSSSQLNNDLDKVSDWAYTWKMYFNADPQNKQKKSFFQGNVLKRIILPYISMIYQSPRLSFKSILGCILTKNSITILT